MSTHDNLKGQHLQSSTSQQWKCPYYGERGREGGGGGERGGEEIGGMREGGRRGG